MYPEHHPGEKYVNIMRNEVHLDMLIDMVREGAYRSILDMGTGNGSLAFALAHRFAQAKVWGIDRSRSAMKKNDMLARRRNMQQLSFLPWDGVSCPFPRQHFDLIVSRLSFHHLPDPDAGIGQMKLLLQPGGRVLISDSLRHICDTEHFLDRFMRLNRDGHMRLYTQEEIDERMEKQGFIVEKRSLCRMQFPFALRREYESLFDRTDRIQRSLYDMRLENGVVWVGRMDVCNTLYALRDEPEV